jgi:hypothetical protein
MRGIKREDCKQRKREQAGILKKSENHIAQSRLSLLLQLLLKIQA